MEEIKMGAFTMQMEKMNRTIVENQKQVEKLAKKLEQEKNKKQEQKEYEKSYKESIEMDLTRTFQRCFERDGLEKGLVNLQLLQTRNEVLQNVAETELEADWINKNYEKILNKVKKIYENDEKAKNKIFMYQLQQQQMEQTTQQQKENKIFLIFTIIGKILKWICLILFGGIYFIFKVLLELAKKA